MQVQSYVLRSIAVWIAIIVAESIHGTLRELLLKPAIGDLRARQLSFITAVALIFAITVTSIKWINAGRRMQLLWIGIIWVVLTTTFEAFLVRPVLGISWERFYSDYNIFDGGTMGIAMITLALIPWAAARMRGVGSGKIDRQIRR